MQKQHHRLRGMLIMAAALAVLTASALFYLRLVNSLLRQETRDTLSEVAEQGANVVRRQIDGDFQTLQTVAALFGRLPDFDPEEDRELLSRETVGASFKRMGLITPDGTAYTSDKISMNLGEREYFHRAMQGETVVSQALRDYIDGDEIYVYATPVRHDGGIPAVLFATTDADVYAGVLDVRMFDGAGYSYIVNSGGQVLMRSPSPESAAGMENLFDTLLAGKMMGPGGVARIREDLANGRSGVAEYFRESARYLSYTPVEINDWFVVSSVSQQVAAEKSTYLSALTLTACLTVMAVVISLFWYILSLQRRSKTELERLAFTDRVTGGLNWNGFSRTAEALLKDKGAAGRSLVSLDIDKFKVLNDLFGHLQGNRTMVAVRQVLDGMLGSDELAARISSDNFNLLLRPATHEEVSERIREIDGAVRRRIDGMLPHYSCSLSFGVYTLLEGDRDLSLMSDRASMARRTVKGTHGRQLAFYDHGVRDRIVAEKEIENRMARALREGEFEVYLQPKYSIPEGKLAGAEALVRWNQPGRGMVPPGEFIPLFERNGFVVQVDAFVFERVCEQLKGWLDEGLGPLPVSVNASRRNLHNPDFERNVIETAAGYGVPEELIELELTESSVLDFEDTDTLIALMKRLKEAGFRISMDDFGTGYSSLNLLRKLPVDVLKLDRAFFDLEERGGRGETVIADVIAMAKHLRLTVVAEGVETEEQVNFLASIGCDVVQGYYFARPMPIADYERLWKASLADAQTKV